MKSVNKILLLFLFFLFSSVFVIWQGLQSEWFADKVSTYATKYAKEIFETDIQFKAIEFKLFPPGAELRQVVIKGDDQGVEFSTRLSNLGFYFNPIDAFETKFKVNKIILKDGYLNVDEIKIKKEEGPSKTIDLAAIFSKISKLPLNQIHMHDFLLNYKGSNLAINELQLRNKKNRVDFEGAFENISLASIIKIDKTIDEVYIRGKIDPERLKIDEFYAKKDFANIRLSGKVDNYVSKNVRYSLKLKGDLTAPMITEYIDLSKLGELRQGDIDFTGAINGLGSEIKGTVKASAKDFDTDFLYGTRINAELNFNNKRLRVSALDFKANEQSVKLLKSFELFNFQSKKWIEEPVLATAKNFRTDNFLSILKGKLDFIDASLSGDVKFILEEDYYTFELGTKSFLHDLVLIPGGKRIFHLKDFSVTKGLFRIDKTGFSLDTLLKKEENSLPISGFFNKEVTSLKLKEGKLDFKEIDPFIDFKLEGISDLSFELYKKEDLYVDVDLNSNNFIFSEYYFDKIKTDLKVNLDKSTVTFQDLKAEIGVTKISSQGTLNYKTAKILADYQFRNLTLDNMKNCLLVQREKIAFDHEDINGAWDGGGVVSEGISLETMKMRGFLKGTNNFIYEEDIENLKFTYNLENNIFKVDDFVAKKANGHIYTKLLYRLGSDQMSFTTRFADIALSEVSNYSKIPLDLQGDINATLIGFLDNDKWKLEGDVDLDKTSVLSEKYVDSKLTFEYDNEILNFNLDGFGGKVKIDSKLNFKNKYQLSEISLDLEIPVIRKLLGIFSGVDVLDNSLVGSLSYSTKLDFYWENLKVRNLDINLKEINLKKGLIDLAYKKQEPEIIVQSGKIKKWKSNLRGRNFYIISDGSGDLDGNHKILTNLKVDASILEVFSSLIPKASGSLRGKVLYANGSKGRDYDAVVTSNNLSLSSSLLPTSITRTNMQLSFAKGTLNIDKFRAELISGFLDLSGSVGFESVFPDIDIKYRFKDAGINILKKSNLIFSGNGSFLGKKSPYTLSGDFSIQRFVLVNEIADFTGQEGSFLDDEIKYLPGTKQIAQDYLIDLNLNVNTREPIYIKNSLADIGFVGSVQVVGNERDPRLIGGFSLAARENFVSFKSNNFVFSKGNILYDQEDILKNPELDFLATTSINEYKVYAKLLGPVKSFDFTFASEPPLVQSDILSLVAFGYTEDVSGNLSDAEKESLTRASVGSLLFDSFKINETLKNEFGLQVNLGTEISRNEGSLLSQRNAESNVENTGVTSATTFEVKKQLSDAMSLSVSSTVGDSRTQRQGVNLNYIVNKKVSLEGVYETNNTDETQTINNTNSFGADVKVRWSFK